MKQTKHHRRTDGISYRQHDGAWYSSVTGKYLPLRDEQGEKIKGLESEQEAKRAYHRLAALSPVARLAALSSDPVPPPTAISIAEVCGRYLEYLSQNRSPATYRRASQFLNNFLGYWEKQAPAASLTKKIVNAWIGSRQWNNNTSNRAGGTLLSCLNWAVKTEEILTANPIAGLSLPKTSARASLISAEAEQAILKLANPAFAQFFGFLLETGARPFSEAAKIEASHLREVGGKVQVVFKAVNGRGHKTAHTGKDRVILCSDRVSCLLRNLAAKYPTGPLFRTKSGKAWRENNARTILNAIKIKQGVGKEITIYSTRHTFATRKLAAGAPMAIVAGLLGNTIAICERHYSHLNLHGNALLAWVG